MLIYKDKGPHSRPGGTFDFKGVSKSSELKEALENGYFLTMTGVEKGKDPDSAWRNPELETLEDDLTPPEEREPEDASEERTESESDPAKHQDGDGGGETTETSGSDSTDESGD